MDEQQKMNEGKTLPEYKYRSGGVEGSIWNNVIQKEGQEINVKSVRIEKKYKDKEGNWQSTNSYSSNDLADLILVAQSAQKYIRLKGNKGGE